MDIHIEYDYNSYPNLNGEDSSNIDPDNLLRWINYPNSNTDNNPDQYVHPHYLEPNF
jgi:hypothetical protein